MIHEYDHVVLQTDVLAHRLRAGDVGTVVMVHQGGQGYTVEFLALAGETVAVETLGAVQVHTIKPNEITCARALASRDVRGGVT